MILPTHSLVSIALILFGGVSALADPGTPSPAPTPTATTGAQVASSSAEESQGADAQGDAPVRRRARQAEGSQAPNKFEADPVLKSQYQVEGRNLEVDPD